MQSVDAVLRQAAADLNAIGVRWAVIGGLAVAFRAEPRFTKDVDLAVAVADDKEAEGIVNRLQVRGYALTPLVEQDYVNRLATARLVRPKVGTSSAFIDLLFANSGIENEIVRRADRLKVLSDVSWMPITLSSQLTCCLVLDEGWSDYASGCARVSRSGTVSTCITSIRLLSGTARGRLSRLARMVRQRQGRRDPHPAPLGRRALAPKSRHQGCPGPIELSWPRSSGGIGSAALARPALAGG